MEILDMVIGCFFYLFHQRSCFQCSTTFLDVDMYMDRTVHTFWYVELYMHRTVLICWYVDLYNNMECTLYGPYNIWNMGDIWALASRVGGPGGGAPVRKKIKLWPL